jgi:Domain of unknown function (DUF932)
MSVITTASQQWMSRPDDERFTSLTALAAFKRHMRETSREVVVSSRKVNVQPAEIEGDYKSLLITGPNGHAYAPTHHSFGQLANLAGAPAGYLRTLPAPIVADAVNYGLKFNRGVDDVGCLLTREEGQHPMLRAATGPKYGRVWDQEPAEMLVERFGDGVTGQWRVPGEFGKAVEVTKANTTLYAGDRDMFVFLADEERRIEIDDRRDGKSGSLARGFFVWNSEVGSKTLGAAFFLFDYVCCNRMIWGARQFQEVRIRHTSGAPDRWLEEVAPVLQQYSEASAKPVVDTINNARKAKIDEDVGAFLAKRFGKAMGPKIEAAHVADEGRPIATLWDATVGATAFARTIEHQDSRVEVEREAGKLLAMVTAG